MILVFFEILFIFVILLVLFGSNKFPEMMKNLGEGVKAFKEGVKTSDSKKASSEKDATEKASKKGAVKKASTKKNVIK